MTGAEGAVDSGMVADPRDADNVGNTNDAASDSGRAGDACLATKVQAASPTKYNRDMDLLQRLKSMPCLQAGQPAVSPGGRGSARTEFFVYEKVCPICTELYTLLEDIVDATLIARMRSTEFR